MGNTTEQMVAVGCFNKTPQAVSNRMLSSRQRKLNSLQRQLQQLNRVNPAAIVLQKLQDAVTKRTFAYMGASVMSLTIAGVLTWVCFSAGKTTEEQSLNFSFLKAELIKLKNNFSGGFEGALEGVMSFMAKYQSDGVLNLWRQESLKWAERDFINHEEKISALKGRISAVEREIADTRVLYQRASNRAGVAAPIGGKRPVSPQ